MAHHVIVQQYIEQWSWSMCYGTVFLWFPVSLRKSYSSLLRPKRPLPLSFFASLLPASSEYQTDACGAAMLADLPDAAVDVVLQHLPLQDLLQTATVNKRLMNLVFNSEESWRKLYCCHNYRKVPESELALQRQDQEQVDVEACKEQMGENQKVQGSTSVEKPRKTWMQRFNLAYLQSMDYSTWRMKSARWRVQANISELTKEMNGRKFLWEREEGGRGGGAEGGAGVNHRSLCPTLSTVFLPHTLLRGPFPLHFKC
jgi:hypothetical protein